MPTRNISLTPEQDAFIEKAVKSGEYQNANEAVQRSTAAHSPRSPTPTSTATSKA